MCKSCRCMQVVSVEELCREMSPIHLVLVKHLAGQERDVFIDQQIQPRSTFGKPAFSSSELIGIIIFC